MLLGMSEIEHKDAAERRRYVARWCVSFVVFMSLADIAAIALTTFLLGLSSEACLSESAPPLKSWASAALAASIWSIFATWIRYSSETHCPDGCCVGLRDGLRLASLVSALSLTMAASMMLWFTVESQFATEIAECVASPNSSFSIDALHTPVRMLLAFSAIKLVFFPFAEGWCVCIRCCRAFCPASGFCSVCDHLSADADQPQPRATLV